MVCCCKTCAPSPACLGHCDLPKHRCLIKDDVKPGPIPSYQGWRYNSKDSPEHQLRCGWRPGHIPCDVLKLINCVRGGSSCDPCISDPYPCEWDCARSCRSCSRSCRPRGPCSPSPCGRTCLPKSCLSRPCSRPRLPQPCSRPCFPRACSRPCLSRRCGSPCDPALPDSCDPYDPDVPVLRITRHNGKYLICTKPSDLVTAPSSPFPLKYVLNTSPEEEAAVNKGKSVKYSIEGKFNEYNFDYVSSEASFVVDFSPPAQKCMRPCQTRSCCSFSSRCC